MEKLILTTSSGTKANIYKSGNSGPNVLLVHGNSLGAEIFLKQLNSPLAEKYSLIAIDLPGCGNSEFAGIPEDAYSLPAILKYLQDVVEQLQLKEVVMVGHSLGGHLVLEAAENIPQTKGVVIFGTPPLSVPPAMDNAFLPNPAGGLFFQADLSEENISAMANAIFAKGKIADEVITQLIRKSDKNFRAQIAASIFNGAMKDEVKIVGSLNKPIAIFHGEHDQLVNIEYLQALKVPSLNPKEIKIIPNAGHCPQWENSEIFNELLDQFIKDIN